jgi:hypothetical protein
LVKYGFNNPHFATFGRATLLKSERFRLGLRGSDIEYFLKIFGRKPRVASMNVLATLGEEGGYSNVSYRLMLLSNASLVRIYAKGTNWVAAVLSVLAKFGYRLASVVYYKIFRARARDCSSACKTLF